MKNFTLILIVVFSLLGGSADAQYTRYIVKLKDKQGTPYSIANPQQFLTLRSIDRRLRYSIPVDETDLPITPRYIDSIRLAGNVTILNVSKWLNQVCIQTSDAAALNKINTFPFVLGTSAVGARMPTTIAPIKPYNKSLDPIEPTDFIAGSRPQSPTDFYNYGIAYPQIHLNNGEFLHNYGFRGEGMQIAVIDAGFVNYTTLPTFDSVRNSGRLLGVWDFVSNHTNVEDHPHGTSCFSAISANLPGNFVGTAPKSSFYLYRSEDASSEYPVEEQNFAAASERADSLGVDVFSVSLGYVDFTNAVFNYTRANLDGNTTISARAADFAAKKGIMVVVAAGNDGNGGIGTPADADSVLTVGAVNAAGQPASFSSVGPSADGQIKPDVVAVGWNAVVANTSNGQPTYGSGTSYACPIMAGIATCLWQAFPEVNNMTIIQTLREAGNNFATPSVKVGYGIPDAKKAFVRLIKKLYAQQFVINSSCSTGIHLTVKSAAGIRIDVERQLPTEANYSTLFTENSTGSFSTRHLMFDNDLADLSDGISIKYRVKMTIGTDTTFYLDSTTVNYIQACNNAVENITISPNPVSDQLFVTVLRNNAVKVSIQIHQSNGQKVYTTQGQSIVGVQTFTIPVKTWSRGMYWVSVYLDNKKVITKKIVRE